MLTRTTRALALFAAMVGAAAACNGRSVTAGPSTNVLARGTWGGENAGAIVDDTIAHVHIGCTLGDFPPPAVLDAEGRFSVDGSYTLRAFPVAVGPPLPAVFSGVVNGNQLTLSVAVNDTVEKKLVPLGPVTMVLGRDPRMQTCPICRAPNAASRISARVTRSMRSTKSPSMMDLRGHSIHRPPTLPVASGSGDFQATRVTETASKRND